MLPPLFLVMNVEIIGPRIPHIRLRYDIDHLQCLAVHVDDQALRRPENQ